MRAAVRSELAQRGGMHRYVDSLKKADVRVGAARPDVGADDAKPKP